MLLSEICLCDSQVNEIECWPVQKSTRTSLIFELQFLRTRKNQVALPYTTYTLFMTSRFRATAATHAKELKYGHGRQLNNHTARDRTSTESLTKPSIGILQEHCYSTHRQQAITFVISILGPTIMIRIGLHMPWPCVYSALCQTIWTLCPETRLKRSMSHSLLWEVLLKSR